MGSYRLTRTGPNVHAREFEAADNLVAVVEAKLLARRFLDADFGGSQPTAFEVQCREESGEWLTYHLFVSR